MRLLFITISLLLSISLKAQTLPSDSAENLRQQGITLKSLGKHAQSEAKYLASLSLYEANNDFSGVAKCYNSLALLYQRMNRQQDALLFFLKASRLNEQLGAHLNLSKNYRNLGRFYYFQKNYDKSLKYFNMAKNILPEPIEAMSLAIIYSGLGSIYSNDGFAGFDLELAQSQYYSALALFQDARDSSNIALGYNNLGLVFEQSKKHQQAVNYYQKSLDIKELLGNKKGILVTCLNIGNVLKKDGDYERSLNYYEKGILLAKELNDELNYLHLLSNIVDVKMELGYADEAARLFEEYRELRDSIYSEEQSKQLAELQTKYETEEKDREIALQKSESEKQARQNQLLTLLVIIISLLSIATFWFFSQRQRALRSLSNKEEELHQQQVTKLQKEQEIKSLNAMMLGQEQERQRIASDLHDRIGSKLSAIMLFSESGKSEAKIKDLLNQTIQETREIAHNLASGILSKFGLAAALQDLTKTLNDTRKIKAHLTTTNFDERLESSIENNVYSIAQELINNTLRHANANNIFIQITVDTNGTFTMIYEDDGKGFDPSALNGSGMGIGNLKARATQINAELTIDASHNKGQTTIISFGT